MNRKSFRRLSFVIAFAAAVVATAQQRANAAAGTQRIAQEGHAVSSQPHWPKGTSELLNLDSRGDGWNDWFSEWPSDVNHYRFKAANVEEVNALIAQFAKIESENLHIRLSPEKEPRGLGWVTSLKEGNGTPVMFSIGSQKQIDDWFKRLDGGKFGVMVFEKAPVAVPPTLTIFVANSAVELSKLKIPQEIDVSSGPVPTHFWEWNRKDRPDIGKPKLTTTDPELQGQLNAIAEFLKQRQGQAK